MEIPSFTISEEQLVSLKGKVIIITGGSSGIGLATTKLLLKLGAKVVVGDIDPPPTDVLVPELSFVRVDVTVWEDLLSLFNNARDTHGQIDHVFVNAGIASSTNYVELDVNDQGNPLPATTRTIDINLIGMINTASLAIHYMKQQENGGSIVMTSSLAGLGPIGMVDYATSKHGIIGFMRGLLSHLHPSLPIRINAITPSWTISGLATQKLVNMVGITAQPAEFVAPTVAIAMADESRHGQLLYSGKGEYKEIERPIVAALSQLLGFTPEDYDGVNKVVELEKKIQAKIAKSGRGA
ncbi:hypothetical protein BDY21DRAFT_330494 [Lineolata rhizophorae]|uniref:Uncharacterized protein n=1 Tax=Lineolata rhizophorae TaxID=578093 RepID=A0A6A6PDP9_9PEZI|nr:hypothetical protein BDY21DRAFT_330494 [Lineolata rhizophorae]